MRLYIYIYIYYAHSAMRSYIYIMLISHSAMRSYIYIYTNLLLVISDFMCNSIYGKILFSNFISTMLIDLENV